MTLNLKEKKRIKKLYKKKPKNGEVICLDEFGPIEVRPTLGSNWRPIGKPDRVPATYTRNHGVRHFLAAYNVHGDKLYGLYKRRKRSREFLQLLERVRKQYPLKIKLYLVMDNFSTHKTNEVDEWLENNNAERILTATNASWMNRIECHFTPLSKFAIKNSNPENHSEIRQSIQKYVGWRNRHPRTKKILKAQKKTRTL